VNNVLPGFTQTERLTSLAQTTAHRQNISQDQVEMQWKKQTPVGRFAHPSEIAHAVGFLASPQSGFITGINLPVDGGRTGSL
jgi:3-oxoacyl-[acyl-carrier protein] reductase